MTKRLLALFSFVVCFNSWGITHAECEALKTDISARLDTIDNSVSYTLSYVSEIDDIILNTYTAKFSTTNPTDPGSLDSTSSTYYYDSSGNPLGTLGEIHTKLNSIRSTCDTVTNNTAYIRGLLSSVSCDDSTNGCNCADQLAVISQQVDSIFGQVSIISTYTVEIANTLMEFYVYLQHIIDREDLIYNATSNIVYDLSFLGSQFLQEYLTYDKSSLPTMTASYFTPGMYRVSSQTTNNNLLRSIFDGTRGSGSLNVSDLLVLYGRNVPAAISSINNYLYSFSRANTNLLKSVDTNITSVSSKFSIFNDFVFSADAPLSMYTDRQTDGSYHNYLTNYYIKVSNGQQSGSDAFTNWFSRVELLLAALVFQDEDNSSINTNGVPSESDKNSVTEIGSSLDQTISGFVQDGNSHVSSVDTSGQSIIRMISSWNTAIGQTAKPAPFVVAEFSSPDSQSRSNISLWLDTEDEKLSSLIEIGHGISTLAWVGVFLLLGYNLAVYSIRVLRKLISFSFSLYSAIFGGG